MQEAIQSPKTLDRLAAAAAQKTREKEFWLDKFSGKLVKTIFPYDRKETVPIESVLDIVKFDLPGKVFKKLMTLCNGSDSRVHMVLTAVLAVLLKKYTRSNDIILGTTILKQEADDSRLINTILALRIHLEDNITFKDLLLQVKQTILQAEANRNYPFEILLKQLGLSLGQDPSPLFGIGILNENLHYKRYLHDIKPGMLFSFSRTDDSGEGKLEYNACLYDCSTIERIISHFTTLMSQVLFNTDLKLWETNIISPEEKKQILYDFNNTRKDINRDKNYHHLFEEQAVRTPDRIAAANNDQQLTYQALNREANPIAHYLIEVGCGEDAAAAIYMKRSLKMLAAIVGIFKASGAYLALDIDYPPERILDILQDSEARIIITEKENRSVIDGIKTRLPCLEKVLCLDHLQRNRDMDTLNTYKITNPGTRASPDNLAYLIYTSGTTGKPKGVMIHQLGMINHLYANINFLSVTDADIIAQTASPCFDISVWQFLAMIILGGTTFIIDKEFIFDPLQLLRVLQKGKVTILEAVPSLMSAILEIIQQQGIWNLEHLRWMIPTGEALKVSLAREWYKYYPGIKLVNAYGPAEASDDVTLWVIDQAELERQNTIPIGKPLPNLHIYIMDPHLMLCPVKVAGEICIAGIAVGKGYLKDPEKTAKSFVPNPFVEEIGDNDYATLYKTGDMGYFTADGNIHFLGRQDHQVKVRGYRIELEEIENQLMNMEEIKETVVTAQEDQTGEKYLCGYIVTETADSIPVSILRERLSRLLPNYMIPSYFVFLDKIPLTPNGKVDRQSLPEPEVKGSREYRAPKSKIEKLLAETWQEVLEIDSVGIDDNFFEIGGDSIKAIQITTRLRKHQLKLDITDLFTHPFIRELSQCVTQTRIIINQQPVQGEVILTPIQRCFFESHYTDSHHYNNSVMLYREQGFDVNMVQRVFEKLVLHHDALRMVFKTADDRVLQQNRGPETKGFHLEVLEFTGSSQVEKDIQDAANRVQASISLTDGPLVKLGLFHTAMGSHLLLVIHHLVIDGISWRILLEDFGTGYRQVENGEEVKFPAKTHPYQYWAKRLEEYAESKKALKELSFWKNIETQIVEKLPKDHPIDAEKNRNKYNETLTMSLNKQETRALLKEVNQAYNTEINDILLTSLGLTVNQWCGNKKVLVILEGHGREDCLEGVDISRTIGWFTSEFPVILDMTAAPDPGYCIKRVKETLRNIPHKGFNYGILKYMTPHYQKQGLTFNLEPEISFNYLGQMGREHSNNTGIFTLSQMPRGDIISPELENIVALDINGMISEGILSLYFTYNKHQYNRHTIERLVNTYQATLIDIIRHCSRKETKELTPSDFGCAEMEIEEYEMLENEMSELE